MKIKKLEENVYLLETNHGDEVLYSFHFPVAGFMADTGYFILEDIPEKSEAHVEKYLTGIERVYTMPAAELEGRFL